jgi:hypothetical protein
MASGRRRSSGSLTGENCARENSPTSLDTMRQRTLTSHLERRILQPKQFLFPRWLS